MSFTILKQLEKELIPYGQSSKFEQGTLSYFPERILKIFDYKIFGKNLLAIPAELIIDDDEEEYELPVYFISSLEEIDYFESEYREYIPADFKPFAFLYSGDEIVLYNEKTDNVHIFHITDVTDTNFLNYKLSTEEASLDIFIKSLKCQTVTCFINPQNYSEYKLLEIRDNEIYHDYDYTETSDIWNDYLNICRKYSDQGLTIHYAPAKVLNSI